LRGCWAAPAARGPWAGRCTACPDGTDVPWHRVINSQGRISTSCLQHDANLQKELLEAEGVVFDKRDRVNWEVYGWEGLDWAELDALWRAD